MKIRIFFCFLCLILLINLPVLASSTDDSIVAKIQWTWSISNIDDIQSQYDKNPSPMVSKDIVNTMNSLDDSMLEIFQYNHVIDGLRRQYTVPYSWEVDRSDSSAIKISSPDGYCSATFTIVRIDKIEDSVLFNKERALDYVKKLDKLTYDYTFDYNDSDYNAEKKLFSVGMKSIRDDDIIRRLFILPSNNHMVVFFVEMDPFTRPDVREDYLKLIKNTAETIQL